MIIDFHWSQLAISNLSDLWFGTTGRVPKTCQINIPSYITWPWRVELDGGIKVIMLKSSLQSFLFISVCAVHCREMLLNAFLLPYQKARANGFGGFLQISAAMGISSRAPSVCLFEWPFINFSCDWRLNDLKKGLLFIFTVKWSKTGGTMRLEKRKMSLNKSPLPFC